MPGNGGWRASNSLFHEISAVYTLQDEDEGNRPLYNRGSPMYEPMTGLGAPQKEKTNRRTVMDFCILQIRNWEKEFMK